METAIRVLVAVCCFVWLLYMYRVWKAYRLRIGIMREDLDTYFRLPSLGAMVFKFWKPLSSFVEEAKREAKNETHTTP